MDFDATYLAQLLLNGLMLGLIYALIAVGLALIFGVLKVINFAHGELLMLGAYAMAVTLPHVGLDYWTALAAAVALTTLAGFLLYELFLCRARRPLAFPGDPRGSSESQIYF